MDIQFFQHCVKETLFFPLASLFLFCSTDACIFLTQYHTVLNTVALQLRSCESGSVSSQKLFFLFKTGHSRSFAIPYKPSISSSISTKSPLGILLEIELNLWVDLEGSTILIILSFPNHKHAVSPFTYIFFNYLSKFYNFQCTYLALLLLDVVLSILCINF